MDIGAHIKELRKVKKMTQADLAAAAEISRSYLADVEAGRYNPSLETLSKLAKALSVEVSTLFRNSGYGSADSDPEHTDYPEVPNENTDPAKTVRGIGTIAAHKTDGYEDGLTEDEKIAVRAFLETYRKQKQMEKAKKGE